MFSSARPSRRSPSYRAIYRINLMYNKYIVFFLIYKKTIGKKVAVAFPDAHVKPVAMPRPAVSAPFKRDFKSFFTRLKKTTK
jgi:hypothetical protein